MSQPDLINKLTPEMAAAINEGNLRKLSQLLGESTLSNSFTFGDGTALISTTIALDNGTSNKGYLRMNATTKKMQYSNDGSVWIDLGATPPVEDIPVVPEPGAPAADYMKTFVIADGVSPNRIIKYCVKDQNNRTTILSSSIV